MGWFKELELYQNHIPETEEYGISSFIYRNRLLLDAQNLPILRIKIFLAILQEQKGFFGLPNIVIFRRSLKHRVAIKVLNH